MVEYCSSELLKNGPLSELSYRLTAYIYVKVEYFSKHRVRQLLVWKIFEIKTVFSPFISNFVCHRWTIGTHQKLYSKKHFSKVNKIEEHGGRKETCDCFSWEIRHSYKEILFTKVIRLKIDRVNKIKRTNIAGKYCVAFIESERKREVFFLRYCIVSFKSIGCSFSAEFRHLYF